jgi:hypothetical protein
MLSSPLLLPGLLVIARLFVLSMSTVPLFHRFFLGQDRFPDRADVQHIWHVDNTFGPVTLISRWPRRIVGRSQEDPPRAEPEPNEVRTERPDTNGSARCCRAADEGVVPAE